MSTSRTVNYDALLTTTFEQVTSKGWDIISQQMPFFMWLTKKGGVNVTADGGSQIRRNIAVRFNTDGGAFAAGDVISATDQNPVEPAFADWAHYDKPTVFFTQEELHNQGKERIMDLGKAKMEQTLKSLKNDLAKDQYGAGGNNKLLGLKAAMSKDTYTTDSYLGLSRATYSDWRPQYSGSATSYCYDTDTGAENLINGLTTMYLNASKGSNGAPDFGLTSITGLMYYHQRLFEKLRIQDNELADAGFTNLKFMGCTIMCDPYLNTTDGTCQGSDETFYLLNSKTWEMVIQKGANFQTIGPKQLEEQLGKRWDTFFFGQMLCLDPGSNALLTGVAAAGT